MDWWADSLLTIRDFFERGTDILVVIAVVIASMWTLIISRWLYLSDDYRWDMARIAGKWPAARALSTRDEDRIHEAAVFAMSRQLFEGLSIIRCFAMICPLLGLLGTVTGMILIFDSISALGTSSARSVASGVSSALVTTMAGMVGALSGIFPAAWLGRTARARLNALTGADISDWPTPNASAPSPWRRLGKHALAAPIGAAAVTLSLLFAMENAIVFGRAALTEPTAAFSVDYIRTPRERVVERREPRPDRPGSAQDQPELPPPSSPSQTEPGESFLAVAAPRVDASRDAFVSAARLSTGFASVADGDYLPIVKVAPIYPPSAGLRGLEGWVMVRFTVTATGSVRDVEVVDSSNEIFEDAAVAAAEKFRYKPRVVGGEPIEVRGVMNRIVFVLGH